MKTDYTFGAHKNMHTILSHKRAKGFTLIELMIVIVIVGILAAIAIPSYQNSVKKSKRSEAQAALLSLANAMERFYTTNGNYQGAAAGGTDSGYVDSSVFTLYVPNNANNSTAYYKLWVTGTADSYTLFAVPINSMAGDGRFRITSTGIKRWDSASNNSWSDTW